jgi:hypothetical protein
MSPENVIEYDSQNKDMPNNNLAITDLQRKINAIIQIFANDLPKVDKVAASIKEFSRLDMSPLNSYHKENINKYIVTINDISSRYLIKTDEDYKALPNADLNKIFKSIRDLCFNLLIDLKLEHHKS